MKLTFPPLFRITAVAFGLIFFVLPTRAQLKVPEPSAFSLLDFGKNPANLDFDLSYAPLFSAENKGSALSGGDLNFVSLPWRSSPLLTGTAGSLEFNLKFAFEGDGLFPSEDGSQVWSDDLSLAPRQPFSFALVRPYLGSQPETYGLLGALAFLGLIGIRRIQHHSLALAE